MIIFARNKPVSVMMKENLIKIYERSFIDNWELPVLTDYNTGERLTYGDFARNIAKLHLLFENSGVKKGDRIALIGKNIPNWVTIFMGTITYGAVIVPILQEFNPADAQHIINHSEATMLFISKSIWENLEFDKMPRVRGVIQLEDMKLLAVKDGEEMITKANDELEDSFNSKYGKGFYRNDIHYAEVPNESLVEINYTSGTTGFSKGVMLTMPSDALLTCSLRWQWGRTSHCWAASLLPRFWSRRWPRLSPTWC